MSQERCSCGAPPHSLGCLQCGATVCPRCAVPMESAAYCPRCAASLMDAPEIVPIEPFDVQ